MSKVKFLVAVVLSVLVAACSEEENLSQADKTGFHVSLTEDVKVDSRSTPEEIGKPLASQFNLKITNQATGNIVHDALFKGKEGTPEFIPAAAGTYDIEATYGDDPVLALDDPYYKGMAKDVVLADGESKTVSVNCTVANALTSVVFSDEGAFKFADQFEEGYGVEVLVLDKTTTLDGKQSAYYRAGSTPTFIFKGTPKNGGEEVSFTLSDDKFAEAATFAAKAHCVITLKIAAVVPGVRVEISKVEVKEETISETIPMGWLPKPKVTATGFDANNTLTFVETEQKQAALNLNLASALQDIRFKFNFQDEQFTALNRDTGYLYSNPADKDIINTTFGINLAENKLDLNNLIAKLQTNAGVTTTNTIEIDVQANNRWSSEVKEDEEAPNLKYILTCNKPEFSIAVQSENCWSREFTVDEVTVSGNADAEKIKANLKYQYYNGTEWVDCATRENVIGRTQQFTDAAEDIATKTYKVRALYRGAIASDEVEATLETPMQLPNSGFEDWYEEDQSDHKNLWFPYVSGASGPQWTTNNLETTNYRSESFCSISAVKRTTIRNSGTYAAWIRTVGHGIANTNVGSFLGLNGSITGTETIGVLSYSDVFAVRPTKVSFNYRYIQKGDDAGVVELKIENKEQNAILFETSFTVTNTDYIQRDILIDYSITNISATHMTLTFKSGSKHTEVVKAKVRGNNVDGTEADEHYGSEFYVDDIQLVYDK